MTDISKALKKIDAIRKRSEKLPWNKIGDVVLKSIDEGFDKGGQYKKRGSFEGGNRRWIKRKKAANHPILQKTRALRRNVKKTARNNSVEIKSDLVYSATQQFGDKGRDKLGRKRNISARPFIVAPSKKDKRISKVIKDHLRDI